MHRRNPVVQCYAALYNAFPPYWSPMKRLLAIIGLAWAAYVVVSATVAMFADLGHHEFRTLVTVTTPNNLNNDGTHIRGGKMAPNALRVVGDVGNISRPFKDWNKQSEFDLSTLKREMQVVQRRLDSLDTMKAEEYRKLELIRAEQKEERARAGRLGQSPYCDVLVLCPIHLTNERRQARFVNNLAALTYDHGVMCVMMLTDAKSFSLCNSSLAVLQAAGFAHAECFAEPEMLRQATEQAQADTAEVRHSFAFQFPRRARIARVRNYLLYSSLERTRGSTWVLWLDNDLLSYPPELMERLLATGKRIVVPVCRCAGVGKSSCNDAVYDKNSWKETRESAQRIARMRPNELRVEGYEEEGNSIGRLHLDDLIAMGAGPVVELDGIGGTCILVDADLHRMGLIFPPFLVNHQIETEGLAQVAQSMGVKVYGLLDLDIRHA